MAKICGQIKLIRNGIPRGRIIRIVRRTFKNGYLEGVGRNGEADTRRIDDIRVNYLSHLYIKCRGSIPVHQRAVDEVSNAISNLQLLCRQVG